MTDAVQSRSSQRAGIVNNEEIKFLIQNRPTNGCQEQEEIMKVRHTVKPSRDCFVFFSFSSPFNNLGADMTLIFYFLFMAVCLVENTCHGGSAWSACPWICHLQPADDVCSLHTFFTMCVGS